MTNLGCLDSKNSNLFTLPEQIHKKFTRNSLEIHNLRETALAESSIGVYPIFEGNNYLMPDKQNYNVIIQVVRIQNSEFEFAVRDYEHTYRLRPVD